MKRMKLSTAYLIVGTVVIALVRRSHAETLLPAAAPTDWQGIGLAFLIGAAIVGLIWFLRHNPGAAAKAKAEAATLEGSLASVATKAVESLHNLTMTHAEAVAKIPGPPLVTTTADEPAAPVAPAGKSGQAGALTIQLTGDPKADSAAFQAAYYG